MSLDMLLPAMTMKCCTQPTGAPMCAQFRARWGSVQQNSWGGKWSGMSLHVGLCQCAAAAPGGVVGFGGRGRHADTC